MYNEQSFDAIVGAEGAITKTRVCTTCRVEKRISEFTRNKSQPSGYMGYCKECNNKRNKIYRRDHDNLARACKRVYGYLSRRVRVKGIDLDFGPEFIEGLYNDQHGYCAYTGDKLSLQAGLPSTMSVDRVDSSLGYTKKNVKLVTWEVNNAKQDRTMESFVLLCKKVIDHGKI